MVTVLFAILVMLVLWSNWEDWFDRDKPDTVVEDVSERMTQEATAEILRSLREGLALYREDAQMAGEVTRLTRELARLEGLKSTIEAGFATERADMESSFARKEREIEHATGLLRKQVDADLELGKREAVLAVQEGNLKEAQEAFESRMGFMTDRFEKEVAYQRELSEQLLERLPTASVKTRLTGTVGGE